MSVNGWAHEEAKRHSVIDRLLERCATYGGGTCEDRGVQREDWCERCLAAAELASR